MAPSRRGPVCGWRSTNGCRNGATGQHHGCGGTSPAKAIGEELRRSPLSRLGSPWYACCNVFGWPLVRRCVRGTKQGGVTVAMMTAQEMFQHKLGDIYDAEHRFLMGQREMLTKATDPQLQGLIMQHIE